MKKFFVVLSTAILFNLITFLCETGNLAHALSCSWNGTQCVNSQGGTVCTGSDGTLSGACQGNSAATCKCVDQAAYRPVDPVHVLLAPVLQTAPVVAIDLSSCTNTSGPCQGKQGGSQCTNAQGLPSSCTNPPNCTCP